MLKIKLLERHHVGEPDVCVPMFFCDYCDEPIEDAGKGLYLWDGVLENEGFFAGEPVELFTLHKGTCDRAFHRERGWGWDDGMPRPCDELEVLLIYLGNNIEIDWRRAHEIAREM